MEDSQAMTNGSRQAKAVKDAIPEFGTPFALADLLEEPAVDLLLKTGGLLGEDPAHKLIRMAIEHATSCRADETAMRDLVRQKDIQLKEMQHRFANSLQIIASTLSLSARAVRSDEARQHLRDAHHRVMAVAAVQEQLTASKHGDAVALRPYLERLCRTLAKSMIGGSRTIVVTVNATDRVPTSDAMSIGSVVTELLINAAKHAFPVEAAGGKITVDYRSSAAGWSLDVSDDGIGLPAGCDAAAKGGLGTGIVQALARKLGAEVVTTSDEFGTRVSIRCRARSERIAAVA